MKMCGYYYITLEKIFCYVFTRKKSSVDPDPTEPYLILVCLAKSSAEEIGESIRSTVRKAAKLAVYEEIMISVKNHHNPATIRVDVALFFKNRATFMIEFKRKINDIYTWA